MNIAHKYNEVDAQSAIKLTRMVMRLFDHWKLTYFEQSILLGLSVKTNASIAKYRKGCAHLKMSRDTYDRVRFLLAIHKSLKQIFPMNNEIAYRWPKTPNSYFDGKTPVQVIADDGILGLGKVNDFLESYKGY